MKIFLDTNVLIDSVIDRGFEAPRKIVDSYLNSVEKLCVSYLSLANLAYILRKFFSESEIKKLLNTISSNMKVVPGLDQHYYDLQKMSGRDIEDCLQILCAEYERCDLILTRNVEDYRGNTLIPVLTPEQFLRHCKEC
ncbi:MAG: type II toxin-antitoxin system VapC family toxin [Candidatus Cryptobacteroides sp.]